ncbi:prostaglandin F2 receptor negative regulator-like [Protopterus annectens]|uniref:prostaglandin F2 receptor negative regulator-like n=1 Tax=Protopterus annectens TaxID=7888 RepID=UPI001CFB3E9C|nr:prostaglandin F2 receptor negative regulator-like [Protopterus annectens]
MGKSDSGLYFLFILLIFQTVVAVSKARIVAVPKFTLVRVVGNEAIIPCTVSDYDPQVEQDFEWNFSQGTQNIDIISTLEPRYPDSKYKNRVVAGDIMIKRINDSAANLHIKNLQLSDAGTYICKTPSTDSAVKGNYDDSVGMNVIPDGVKVAVPPDVQQQLGDLVEGEEFQLKCSISKNSTECTQISITFEVKTETNGNLQVLSLTQDGKLQPGTKYTERFQSGHIRLETHDDIYLLSVSHALLSDTGTYSSTVTEWIKQQDGTWQVVQQKGVQLAKVNIERIAQVLSVSAVIGNLTLSKGEDTDLTCYIKTGNSNAVSKEVVWYFSTYPTATPGNEKLLASMDRNSMMNRSDYGIISRMDASTYQYMVRNAKETDSGYYYCSVTLWLQESKNTWYRAAEKISDAVQLNVTVSGRLCFVIGNIILDFNISAGKNLPRYSISHKHCEKHLFRVMILEQQTCMTKLY